MSHDRIKKLEDAMMRFIENIMLFENEESDFCNEYRKLRANQLPAKVKESLAQESDPIEELTDEAEF